ncbi:MAG: hypothetical protein NVS3B20_23970 [Polyangiales bacterium]
MLPFAAMTSRAGAVTTIVVIAGVALIAWPSARKMRESVRGAVSTVQSVAASRASGIGIVHDGVPTHLFEGVPGSTEAVGNSVGDARVKDVVRLDILVRARNVDVTVNGEAVCSELRAPEKLNHEDATPESRLRACLIEVRKGFGEKHPMAIVRREGAAVPTARLRGLVETVRGAGVDNVVMVP